jgi:uncharacterized protein
MSPTSCGMIPLRNSGRSGDEVSILGLVGHHLGEAPDERTAVEIVHQAVDGGITFYDNGWEYRRGKTEIGMGAGLKRAARQGFLMDENLPLWPRCEPGSHSAGGVIAPAAD